MCNVIIWPGLDLVIVSLIFKILSGTIAETVKCRKLILGRDSGGVGV